MRETSWVQKRPVPSSCLLWTSIRGAGSPLEPAVLGKVTPLSSITSSALLRKFAVCVQVTWFFFCDFRDVQVIHFPNVVRIHVLQYFCKSAAFFDGVINPDLGELRGRYSVPLLRLFYLPSLIQFPTKLLSKITNDDFRIPLRLHTYVRAHLQ
jgi:hypothetical protein